MLKNSGLPTVQVKVYSMTYSMTDTVSVILYTIVITAKFSAQHDIDFLIQFIKSVLIQESFFILHLIPLHLKKS